jgi:hypothetical protein
MYDFGCYVRVMVVLYDWVWRDRVWYAMFGRFIVRSQILVDRLELWTVGLGLEIRFSIKC